MQQTLSTSSSKTKILRILAVLVTLVLIALGIYVHSRMVGRNDSIPENKSSFFEDVNYDVLFFGTSHVMRGISPFQLYKDYGIISYNMGNSSEDSSFSYYKLLELVKYNKPSIVVIDVYRCSFNFSSDLIRAHRCFDIFPIKNKVTGVFALFKSQKDRIELIFPYTLYHNKWNSDFEYLWNMDSKNIEKGFTSGFLVERNVNSYKKMKWIDKSECLDIEDTDGINFIKKFVLFCKENNIQPVLCYIPPAGSIIQQKESNSIQKIANETKTPYYNMIYSHDIIDEDIDLLDCHVDEELDDKIIDINSLSKANIHLNFSGARKVTDYIGNILRNDFNVPDHRGEAEYAHWEDDYKEYRKYIFGKMKEINEFDTLLMSCNFDDISVKLYKSENVAFDYVEQKLIAQLKDNIEIFASDSEKDASDLRIVVTDDATGEIVTEKSFYMGSALHIK